jgi:hypothetical protein
VASGQRKPHAAASTQNLHACHAFSRQPPAVPRPYIVYYLLRISYSGSTGVKERILYGGMPYEVYVRKNFARKPAAVDLPFWLSAQQAESKKVKRRNVSEKRGKGKRSKRLEKQTARLPAFRNFRTYRYALNARRNAVFQARQDEIENETIAAVTTR